ncbi:hypothetical protein BD410DRAFT_786310 [Rickenella mellea]|uniref:F-box domain-containing protein n=1 Tax=Rickenella mellea TaxID=50990 RepID=A0A4Y7Q9T1_9AGAM|nr:hypothetical protein BD410DRAFT_786310 [Rickenella mellea]
MDVEIGQRNKPDVASHEKADKTSLRQLVVRQRSMGDLLLSLPPEITTEIFYWCSPTFDDQNRSTPQELLYLTHVCRAWRRIAHSSPRLWTYTKVVVYDHVFDSSVDLMKLWIRRAKSCPLFVDVDFVDNFVSTGNVLPVFEKLVGIAQRYRSALPEDVIWETHIELTSNETLPTREEWYFWSAKRSRVKSTKLDAAIFKIRGLRMVLSPFHLNSFTALSPSLTFLELKDFNNFTNLTNDDCIVILSTFPRLIHCGLHLDFSDALAPAPVVLQYLRSFSVSWANLEDVGPLFDALTAPVLKELELSGVLPNSPNGTWDHLRRFLYRNRPPLTNLIMDGIDCFHIELLDCLSICSVERLWLEDCVLDDNLVEGFHKGVHASDRPPDGVLRSLKMLSLWSCVEFTMDQLISVLAASKAYRGKLLDEVYVRNGGRIREDHYHSLKTLGVREVMLDDDE